MKIEEWRKKFAGDPDVLSVEQARSPLNGGTVELRHAVEITMAGGGKAYGCVHDDCAELANHPTSIVSHHYPAAHPGPEKRAYRKTSDYLTWSVADLIKAIKESDSKIARITRARDNALDQVATVREVSRETIANLRAELAEVTEDRDRIRAAVNTLFPGGIK
jgi:hypothetical protein